ncbi:MAG: flagellar biosynthesis protein FlhB [Gammaproteobacteria bacterium]|nr:MAG: flagellar biosynthesis protein FlhB [Gammaproteobacteria bacterium]
MAEEQQGQEKTEEPTPRKREKAQEEGQVARSRELSSMALIGMGGLGLMLIAPPLAERMVALTRHIFELATHPEENLLLALNLAANELIWLLLPFLAALSFAGVMSSVALGGFVLSPKAMAFKASRMSPLKGFKRMFSAKSLMELVKSIAKFLLITSVAMFTLSLHLDDLMSIGSLDVEVAIRKGLSIVSLSLLLIGSALVVIAAIDIPFQIAQHKKQLRMTKQEVKDEMKDTEGKPEVRSRIRQVQQEIARRRMLEAVPDADVVITNPEHFSVAIKYDNGAMAAPIVVAKGADHMAFRIRELASANDVPILVLPGLARAVYYVTEPGEEVPAGLYMAVAQVLAYVYQLEMYRRGQTAKQPALGDVPIPPEYVVE